jgi:hypothetical protein
MIHRSILPLAGVLCLAGCGPQGISVPSIFTGLKPQSYTWHPERSASGPVLVFVSLPRQEAVVYRNGVRIGRAAVSSGKSGHSTPTGVFQILEKDIDHRSKTYNNAPMPYMERLTWDGVALHTGFNPGHPASHGCVRLPDGFAKELFKITRVGGTVIISDSAKLPVMGVSGGPGGGASESGSWSKLTKGAPTSVVVSLASRELVVYQNGGRAGGCRVEVGGSLRGFQGETAFLFAGDRRWHAVEGHAAFDDIHDDLRLPDGFGAKLHEVLHPGTTLVVTSEPIDQRGGRSRDLLAVE